MDILRLWVLQPGWLRDAPKRSDTCHSETLLITKDFPHWENEVEEKAGVYCGLMVYREKWLLESPLFGLVSLRSKYGNYEPNAVT